MRLGYTYVTCSVLLPLVRTGAASSKVNDLVSLTEKAYSTSGSAVIKLDKEQYRRFVLDTDKPYHLIVLYTASMRMCRICKPFDDAFEHTALSYYMVCIPLSLLIIRH
jgi:hypothetical protein